MQIKTDTTHMINELEKFKEEFGALGHGGFGKQVISAAEKAVESLQAFNGSLSALDGLAKFFEKTGTKPKGTRSKSPCLVCGKPSIGGRVGRLCEEHKDTPQAKKAALLKSLQERERKQAV